MHDPSPLTGDARAYGPRAQLAAALALALGSRPRTLAALSPQPGLLALLLAALGHTVVALSPLPAPDALRRHAGASDLAITFVQAGVTALPAQVGPVDGVVAADLLALLPDAPDNIRQWRGAVRPGGTITLLERAPAHPALGLPLRDLLAARRGAPHDPPAGLVAPLHTAGLINVQARGLRALRRAEHESRPWHRRLEPLPLTWLAWAASPGVEDARSDPSPPSLPVTSPGAPDAEPPR